MKHVHATFALRFPIVGILLAGFLRALGIAIAAGTPAVPKLDGDALNIPALDAAPTEIKDK